MGFHGEGDQRLNVLAYTIYGASNKKGKAFLMPMSLIACWYRAIGSAKISSRTTSFIAMFRAKPSELLSRGRQAPNSAVSMHESITPIPKAAVGLIPGPSRINVTALKKLVSYPRIIARPRSVSERVFNAVCRAAYCPGMAATKKL